MNKIVKGTHVWLIQNYDSRGTVQIRECIVDSWGNQQAHLRQLDGVTTKHRLYVSRLNEHPFSPWVYVVGTIDPIAEALKLAEAVIAYEGKRLQALLDRGAANPNSGYGNRDYVQAVRVTLAAMHEPRAIDNTKG